MRDKAEFFREVEVVQFAQRSFILPTAQEWMRAKPATTQKTHSKTVGFR